MQAKCPNCGAENTSFFGDILGVQGSRDKNTVDCSSCKSKLTFDALDREVRSQQTSMCSLRQARSKRAIFQTRPSRAHL